MDGCQKVEPDDVLRDFGPMIAFCLSRVSDSCPV